MPYLQIQSNQKVEPAQQQALLRSLSKAVAELLGKPERYVMVAFAPQTEMLFAGDPSPLAYLELKSISLPASLTPQLSDKLCAQVHEALGIPTDRIYIEFSDAPRNMWGWNGGTF